VKPKLTSESKPTFRLPTWSKILVYLVKQMVKLAKISIGYDHTFDYACLLMLRNLSRVKLCLIK